MTPKVELTNSLENKRMTSGENRHLNRRIKVMRVFPQL